MKALKRTIRQLFSERKIIIISDSKVRNIPVDSRLQGLVALALAGGLVWFSYSTGVYFGYQRTLENKQEAIMEISQKNNELTAQNSLMYRDMMRLIKDGGIEGKPEYQNFLLDHYATVDSGPESESNSAVMERIGQLEGRLAELQSYQQNFLSNLSQRAGVQIEDLRKIIEMTGLSIENVAPKKRVEHEASAGPAPSIASDSDGVNYKNQGGPYVAAKPISYSAASASEEEVVMQVARLIQLHDLFDNLPLAFPVKEGRMTSGYGTRRDPLTRRLAVHHGLDFAAPANAPIYCTAPGKVTRAEREGAYGNLVIVDHGNGVTTRYAHMSKIEVTKGQTVGRGTVLGRQGSTGRSTGSHLHYEVRWGDKPMDPKNFIKAGIYARQKRQQSN